MWRLGEDHAAFTSGPLSAKIVLARPHLGLHDVEIAGQRWPAAQLLQVRLPSTAEDGQLDVAEVYVREGDLVVTYAPLPPFTVQPQIYWRLRSSSAPSAVGIELILSVQTSLLFSEPETTVSCRFAPAKLPRGTAEPPKDFLPHELRGVLALPTVSTDYVFVQMIHPSDFHSLSCQSAPDGSLRGYARLFQEHLEKGVIRRGRVCGWLLPSSDWLSGAQRLLEDLRREPPPLTV